MKFYEGISTGLAAILQEKMRSVLTMLGIVIGVAAVLAMLAVGIGLRRAIGAKRRDIFLQFLIEAVVMCSVGGLLGILLGIGTGYLCSHIAVKVVKVIPHWPVVISPHWMTISVSISAGIGILFGLYPAIRASHISPIEALRTE